jgi:hypothetical protein
MQSITADMVMEKVELALSEKNPIDRALKPGSESSF